jgi:riboflavin kinase/FMN adenylyltransferase
VKYAYAFFGKVIRGKARGKNLGFPTANIRLHKNIPEGIYLSHVSLEKTLYPALTFIGSAKTYNETDKKAEAFFLDLNKNIYGKRITIKLIKKIRNNKKFNSEKELVAQMETDRKEALKYFEI